MSDIVERLMYAHDWADPMIDPAPKELLKEAADLIEKRDAEIERLRERVKYWNGIACEDRAEVERLRECLQSIADAPDHEPREPDDADWRYKFLEAKRAATLATYAKRNGR